MRVRTPGVLTQLSSIFMVRRAPWSWHTLSMKKAEPTKTTLACAGSERQSVGHLAQFNAPKLCAKARHGRIAPRYVSQLVQSWAYTVWLRGFCALQASLGQVSFLRTAAAGNREQPILRSHLNPSSFVSQSDHRIDAHGAPRRDKGSEETCPAQNQ